MSELSEKIKAAFAMMDDGELSDQQTARHVLAFIAGFISSTDLEVARILGRLSGIEFGDDGHTR